MPYPILEHDPSRESLTEPSKIIRPRDMPEHVVIRTPKYGSHFIESSPASEGPPATREGKF
jgi:hypothetical protein